MDMEKMRAVAGLLRCSIEETESRFVRLRFPGGGEIILEESRGRLEIHGSFPRSDGNYRAPRGEKHNISVSAEKSAEQIAHDIQRRLLPGYRKAYELAVKEMKEHEEQQSRQEVLAKHLADILGVEIPKHDPLEFYAYDPARINGRTSGDDVKLEITCKPDLAERICRVIANRPEK